MDFRDTHPAKIDPKARLWFGPEVEGARRGEPTAFVADVLTEEEVAKLCESGVKGVFLTETIEDWRWLLHVLKPRLPAAIKSVTMGRFPEQMLSALAYRTVWWPELRFMVRVFDTAWVHQLNAHDEITLGDPYHLRNFRLCDGVLTVPSQYAADTETPDDQR